MRNLLLLFLLPTVLASTVSFENVFNTKCPDSGRHCEITLQPNTNYRTQSEIPFVGYPSVQISGAIGSKVCFESAHILFENVTNVLLKNIQFEPCGESAYDSPSNPHAPLPRPVLSFISIANVTILKSNFFDFYGVMIHISDSAHVFINIYNFESRKGDTSFSREFRTLLHRMKVQVWSFLSQVLSVCHLGWKRGQSLLMWTIPQLVVDFSLM